MKYEQIWKVVQKIPRGKVATYGQIARLAGMDGQPRFAGYALHGLPAKNNIPWHRVINAQGKISVSGISGRMQRRLLEAENVTFSPSGKVDLKKFGWKR